MKQYLIHSANQALEAIAAGARWITLDMPGADDPAVADAIRAIIPPASKAGIIFVVRGHERSALNTLCDDVRASGVLLTAADMSPADAREFLGPHAVIGYEASSAAEILPLARLDIDYFTLPASAMTAELAGVEIPIVAVGAPEGEVPEGFSAVLVEI